MKLTTMSLLMILFGLGMAAMATTDELSDIERDARALELYLQDQKDYEEYCPIMQWNQPPLDIYKSLLTSQLPLRCKD